ncbi:uncharacterized protein LOC143890030 [Tasmannia lanceolata]|uniref:uncharacterized protein LOC143890030 n=1 Tax=Tasmannia lanceolata TaxID=3420 RepID=UPI0040638909
MEVLATIESENLDSEAQDRSEIRTDFISEIKENHEMVKNKSDSVSGSEKLLMEEGFNGSKDITRILSDTKENQEISKDVHEDSLLCKDQNIDRTKNDSATCKESSPVFFEEVPKFFTETQNPRKSETSPTSSEIKEKECVEFVSTVAKDFAGEMMRDSRRYEDFLVVDEKQEMVGNQDTGENSSKRCREEKGDTAETELGFVIEALQDCNLEFSETKERPKIYEDEKKFISESKERPKIHEEGKKFISEAQDSGKNSSKRSEESSESVSDINEKHETPKVGSITVFEVQVGEKALETHEDGKKFVVEVQDSGKNSSRSENGSETVWVINEKRETDEIGPITVSEVQEFGEKPLEMIKEMVVSGSENSNGFDKTAKHGVKFGKEQTLETYTASVSKAGNGDGLNAQGSRACGKLSGGLLHKTVNQETGGNKEKRPRRRAKGLKNGSEMNGKKNVPSCIAEVQNVCERKGNGSKRSYSRTDLEALRFLNSEEQLKCWNEIHKGLGAIVAQELDQMAEAKQPKQGHRNIDRRQHVGRKKEAGTILGKVCFQNMEDIEEGNSFNLACDDFVDDNHSCTVVEEVCDDSDEDENSSEDYDSIQKPAFLVEGEPDFESGPPQDGLEYLRRVRWEAAQIPKVKVVKLNTSKINIEQTAYMPYIPDIAKCPEHLLPSKQWEEAFLADFSELRKAMSRHEIISIENFCELPSVKLVDEVSGEISHDPERPKDTPMVSVILGMDAVSRASMLRKRVSTLEAVSTLSRHDCLWVFALCATVDIPLDAETTASLRCLLRKCATLQAEKSELDDEVVMLNILVAISGRFFGQSES